MCLQIWLRIHPVLKAWSVCVLLMTDTVADTHASLAAEALCGVACCTCAPDTCNIADTCREGKDGESSGVCVWGGGRQRQRERRGRDVEGEGRWYLCRTLDQSSLCQVLEIFR